MCAETNSNLRNKEESEKYYDVRYSEAGSFAYMDDYWQDWKKKRIFDLIKELDLPERGEALDFGCGNGVFTDIIRQALPNYQVYGMDLSQAAIDIAKERYKECLFFHSGDASYNGKKFDFLFTHHVLEHVYDIEKVAEEIADYMKPASTMLHILPCGNKGSLEYNLCMLRKDGVNPDKGGVFFFEDKGHVRRLTTTQLSKIFSKEKFALIKDYYSEQYYGALRWISEANPLTALKMANPFYGKDLEAKIKILKIGALLVFLNLLRMPINIMNRLKSKRINNWKNNLLYTASLIFYPLSHPFDAYIRERAEEEWRRRKKESNGSEMYLVFSQPS